MLRFLFCALFFFAQVVFAEDYTFSDKHIYPVIKRGTDSHSGITFLAGAFVSLMARSSDDQVREQWNNHQKISERDSSTGDLIGTGAAGALVIGSQYLFDPNESNYQSHLRGFIYGGISIYTLKSAFGRNRPGLSDSHQSFPSGHSAITFMSATHLTYAYGWPAALIAYPIAAFTGFTRLADDAHWFSDIVGGAFLGYFVGRATYYDSSAYADSTKNGNQTSYQLIPTVQRDSSGVTFLLSY